MPISISIDLVVSMETVLSVGSGQSSLAMTSVARDGWDRFIISGSHVKGRTRHRALSLARCLQILPDPADSKQEEQSDPLVTIFGSPSSRSPLSFFNLVGGFGNDMTDPHTIDWLNLTSYRSTLAISRRFRTKMLHQASLRETTIDGMIFVATPAITGILDLHHTAFLWASLRLLHQWGGWSRRGLGWATIQVVVRADGIPLTDDDLAQHLQAFVATRRIS